MTDDPGITQLNKWGDDHPLLFGTIRALSLWAILQGVALLIPPVGFLANCVLAIWAMVLLYVNRDRCLPVIERAWDAIIAFAVKGYQSVSRESPEPLAVADARIEGTTAVRAALMDTIEGDIQVSGQIAAWRTQIDRLTDLNSSPSLTEQQRRTNELLIRQLRRNIADVEKAEAERTGVALETHGPRPLFDALLPAEAAPARRLGFLPMIPGFSFPFSWALAAVLAVVGLVQTVRVERVKDDARDLREAVAAEADRANAAETQARMNEVALESNRHEVNVSRELNETLQARQRRLEERQRRNSREEVEAARSGRAFDLDSRLRDLRVQPFASPDLGPGTTSDPAGGVFDGPAPALDLSTPGGLPSGDDGASVGDHGVAR